MEKLTKIKWEKLLAQARAGNARAQWEAGYFYEWGAVDKSGRPVVREDLRKAFRWFKASAAQGDSGAQIALGNLLSTGKGIPRDHKSAVAWYEKALAQGDSSAAFNLATVYRDEGKPALAFRWYQRAASMGDNDSLLELGLCHLLGFGTKQNVDEAFRCLDKIAALRGSDDSGCCQRTEENALYWLAVMNLLGLGKVKRAVKRARAMLEECNADEDHEQANALLNLIGKSRFLMV